MKWTIAIVITIGFFLQAQAIVFASGLAVTNDQSQVGVAESRGIIYHDGTTETLFTNITFNFNALTMWNFAWLIAVPSKPEVELSQKDLFISFDSLLERRDKVSLYHSTTTVTRPSYLMLYKLFHLPNDFENLHEWLTLQGYILPKTANALLTEYGKNEWYVVAVEVDGVHLENNATDSLTLSAAHTIPVKSKFQTKKPLYPLALTAIQQDTDSISVPFTYAYGQSSEQILGEQDNKVDQLLEQQSRRTFPALPLDVSYLKTDLFVIDNVMNEAEGFVVDYAAFVSSRDIGALKLPNRKLFLTHLTNFTPMIQLKDVELQKTHSTQSVNASLRSQKMILKSLLLIVGIIASIYFIKLSRR